MLQSCVNGSLQSGLEQGDERVYIQILESWIHAPIDRFQCHLVGLLYALPSVLFLAVSLLTSPAGSPLPQDRRPPPRDPSPPEDGARRRRRFSLKTCAPRSGPRFRKIRMNGPFPTAPPKRLSLPIILGLTALAPVRPASSMTKIGTDRGDSCSTAHDDFSVHCLRR